MKLCSQKTSCIIVVELKFYIILFYSVTHKRRVSGIFYKYNLSQMLFY